VASLPNLENVHQKEVSPIGHGSWCGKECNVQDLDSVFLARGHVTTFDSREVILDNILGNGHFSLIFSTILETFQW
jgi:hypothetical protein